MNPQPPKTANPLNRRHFLRNSALATTTVAVAASATGVFAAGTDRLRIGLAGCGVRGIGAAMNCLDATQGTELVALGDVFSDRVQNAYKQLRENSGKDWSATAEWKNAARVKVTPETCFSGFDACQKVLAAGVDVLLLAGPPHFRPQHLKLAVEAGKHVFMEKPVAVDPAGIRSIMASSDLAKQKGLAIVAGTQRRHHPPYIEIMKRVREGAIGDVLAGECYWNGGCVRHYGFYHEPKPEWSGMEAMLRNWYFYSWLSGDHIVEQHVHNLDVINWAIGSPPVEALAVGGRQWRTEPQFGNIYDHFAVRYRYPNGALVISMARQIDKTKPNVSELVIGTRGRASAGGITGANAYRYSGPSVNPYEQEHANLIQSIRDGRPLNEGRTVAEATLTAIMGRMSAYSGQPVDWEFALKESQLDLTPPEIKANGYRLGPAPKVPPPARGNEELV